jgi:hypothetical protein
LACSAPTPPWGFKGALDAPSQVHQRVLDDTRYAALLMQNDTMRSKLMARLEILTTYAETQQDLFRALLLAHGRAAEGKEAVDRILLYREETERQLAALSTRKRKAGAPLSAPGGEEDKEAGAEEEADE